MTYFSSDKTKYFVVANALVKMGLFKCDQCKFSALQGSHLKMHVRRIHELRCDICEFVPPYSTKEQLAHHISTVHAGFSYKGACTDDVYSVSERSLSKPLKG